MSYEPLVTVTLGSARPGGLDISFAGLCNQTYKNWELVFVDALYHARHRRVLDYIRKIGFDRPFFHVPNHRYNTNLWGTTCAGYNTGFALAAGELTIILLDYAWTPPDWIKIHVAEHSLGRGEPSMGLPDEKRLVIGSHIYYDMPPVRTLSGKPPPFFPDEDRTTPTPERMIAVREDYDPISILVHPFERLLAFHTCHRKATFPQIDRSGPISPDAFFTKNESFPTATVLESGGMDEYYDRGRGPGDFELAHRLERLGLEVWGCADATVHCCNPRNILPNPNTSSPERGRPAPPHDHRHDHWEGKEYAEKHLNAGRVRVNNPRPLSSLREEIWRWRRLSQEERAVIPRNTLSNEDYFGTP